jgi:tripartite-type tricarboxylate transporter receptor subunit TctC
VEETHAQDANKEVHFVDTTLRPSRTLNLKEMRARARPASAAERASGTYTTATEEATLMKMPASLSRCSALLLSSVLALGSVGSSAFAQAQNYPSKPIKLIVPFPPGGATDPIARIISQKMGERLGQSFVVENIAGGGATIGMSALARATPDGYTLALAPAGALAVAVSLNPKLVYDPRKDFSPISMVAAIPFVVLAKPSAKAQTAAEMIALVKAGPGKYAIGHGGNGTAMHLAAELFKQMTAISLTSVPYKGNGPVVNDLLGGTLDLGVVDILGSLGHIKSGRLKPLAVTGTERVEALPDVPTLAEVGVPGYDAEGWFGLVGPAALPPQIVARLNAELANVLQDPGTQERIRAAGAVPRTSTPRAFTEYLNSEIDKWARVINSSNIKMD